MGHISDSFFESIRNATFSYNIAQQGGCEPFGGYVPWDWKWWCFCEEKQRLLGVLLALPRLFRTGSGHSAPQGLPFLMHLVKVERRTCLLSAPPRYPSGSLGIVFHSSLCVTGFRWPCWPKDAQRITNRFLCVIVLFPVGYLQFLLFISRQDVRVRKSFHPCKTF